VRALRRARLVFLVALAAGLAIIVAEAPVSMLVDQRSALAAASARLRSIEQENAQLAASVAALRQPSTIATIAHVDYGLVKPGQVAYEIPGLVAARGSGALGPVRLPSIDVVPPTASPFGTPTVPAKAPPPSRAGFWSQVLDRLAFWRSSF
jgi:cell division protein FtsB